MASFGRISKFDKTKEDWTQYIERVDNYFVANNIVDEQKKKCIKVLSVVSPASCKLVRSLVAPQKPSEISFTQTT